MLIALLFAATLRHTDPDTTIRIARGSSIEINSPTSSIVVHVGTGDVVVVHGASSNLNGHTLEIGSSRGHGHNRHDDDADGGTISVTVPAWVELDVTAVEGDLTFDGAPARLKGETVNGNIKLTGGSGTAELTTVNGTIAVADFRGSALSLDATNDDITVNGATGTIEVDDVSGGITLRDIHSGNVSANTITGNVLFDGTFAANGAYDFESHNGDVTMYVPADVSARMKVTTFNGLFNSADIPGTTLGGRAPVTGKKHQDVDQQQELTVTYGRGDAHVTASSFDGDVTVKRGPAPRPKH